MELGCSSHAFDKGQRDVGMVFIQLFDQHLELSLA
jgi:hypothetical protein